MNRVFHRICRFDARHRIVVALCTAVAAFVASQVTTMGLPTRLITAWDSFAGCTLGLTWLAMFTADPARIRKNASSQDLSRRLIFVFTVIAACASLCAVIYLFGSAKKSNHVGLHAALSIFAIISGWSLMHTVFALRYAHGYYGGGDEPDKIAGGLVFPEDDAPDYLDFAYFSFVIGMTCQVSDVGIASKKLRRVALIQGLLSFGFNTVILALTINTVSGLL